MIIPAWLATNVRRAARPTRLAGGLHLAHQPRRRRGRGINRAYLALATLAGVAALAATVVSTASAMPPCTYNCAPAGTWFWNKHSAQYQLLMSGLDISGRHYEVSTAVCYGMGPNIWGSKGPMFKKFHCAARLFDNDGNTYPPYGLTFYVRGQYAWTWGV